MVVEGLPKGISKKDFINFVNIRYDIYYKRYSFNKWNQMYVSFSGDLINISLYSLERNYNFDIKVEDYTVYLRDCKIKSIWS